jgi:hypothetical protein
MLKSLALAIRLETNTQRLGPDFYHRGEVRSGAELWPAGLRAETGGFGH